MKRSETPLSGWLRTEFAVRETLKDYINGHCEAKQALMFIDTILGDFTGRGYEFPGEEDSEWKRI
jgi:hypothetical protein